MDEIYAGSLDFALQKTDGSVAMLGYTDTYKDHTVPKSGVDTIFSNDDAFAAVLKTGGVVVWGNGESTHIEPAKAQKLKDEKVVNIYQTSGAFAALQKDGSVVTWGDLHGVNDGRELDGKHVKYIYQSGGAFAAKLMDGHVVAWGDTKTGGQIPEDVHARLHSVWNSLHNLY